MLWSKIDYKRKKVWFHLNNREEFTFSKSCMISMMISSVKVRQMLGKRYIGYLAHIISIMNESISSLHDIPTVFEFPDVLLDNLLDLTVKKEVTFSIESAPKTMPISKAHTIWP